MRKKKDPHCFDAPDLGIVIETPERAFWKGVKENAEHNLKTLKNEILLNEELVKVAEQKLTS